MQRFGVFMVGGSGEIGSRVVRRLLTRPELAHLELVTRRPVPNMIYSREANDRIHAHQEKLIFDRSIQDQSRLALDYMLEKSTLEPDEIVFINTCGCGVPDVADDRMDLVESEVTVPGGAATIAAEYGIEHATCLSVFGADPELQTFNGEEIDIMGDEHLRMKGEIELMLTRLPFRSTAMLRPGLITNFGNARKSISLKATQALYRLMGDAGPAVDADVLAEAIAATAISQLAEKRQGAFVVQGRELQALGESALGFTERKDREEEEAIEAELKLREQSARTARLERQP